MNVYTLDTNTSDCKQSTIPQKRVDLGFVLEHLCSLNKDQEGDPVGPVAFGGEQDEFLLLSAWCGGRQWYYIVELFTCRTLELEEAEEELEAFLKENAKNQDDEEEDED